MKIASSGVDTRVEGWIREFLLGRTQRVRVGGELSDEVTVTSGVPQGSVLGPLLFLAYVNDIGKNTESHIRLFGDDCVIYRKILTNGYTIQLQRDIDRVGEWTVENGMQINPNKSKAILFTAARTKDTLQYYLPGVLVPVQNRINLRSHLSWADQVNSSSLVFSPKAGFGRNQSPVRRPVWLWHTAF